jgi:hypothetical protein
VVWCDEGDGVVTVPLTGGLPPMRSSVPARRTDPESNVRTKEKVQRAAGALGAAAAAVVPSIVAGPPAHAEHEEPAGITSYSWYWQNWQNLGPSCGWSGNSKDVWAAQAILYAHGLLPLEGIDGNYGPGTTAAMRQLENVLLEEGKSTRIKVDGCVDGITWETLQYRSGFFRFSSYGGPDPHPNETHENWIYRYADRWVDFRHSQRRWLGWKVNVRGTWKVSSTTEI